MGHSLAGNRSNLVVAGPDPAILEVVTDPHCALVWWDRPVPSNITAELDPLDFDEIDDLDAHVQLEVLATELPSRLVYAGHPNTIATLLAEDIVWLATLHGAILRTDAVGIRLEVIERSDARAGSPGHEFRGRTAIAMLGQNVSGGRDDRLYRRTRPGLARPVLRAQHPLRSVRAWLFPPLRLATAGEPSREGIPYVT